MGNLEGKAAVVTGGSRGIGFAIADALAAAGSSVAITGRDQTHLDAAAAALERRTKKSSVLAIRADVRDARQATEAIDSAVQRFGALDVLVNNAGVGLFGNVADMSVADWDVVIQTNLSGVFYCSRAAIRHLRSRGAGWIINISSLASENPFAGGAAYCATKAGLDAFSECLMQELRYDNIRVSSILPGSVATGFAGRGEDGKADWKIDPADIARLVIELVTFPSRSLPSRIHLRPSRPPKK